MDSQCQVPKETGKTSGNFWEGLSTFGFMPQLCCHHWHQWIKQIYSLAVLVMLRCRLIGLLTFNLIVKPVITTVSQKQRQNRNKRARTGKCIHKWYYLLSRSGHQFDEKVLISLNLLALVDYFLRLVLFQPIWLPNKFHPLFSTGYLLLHLSLNCRLLS